MSIQRNPEKDLPFLLTRLHVSLEAAVSEFQNIDLNFQQLKIPPSGFKQDTLLARFKAHENDIYRILSNAEDKFNHIKGDLSLVNDKIERVNKALPDITGDQSSYPEEAHARKLFEERFGRGWEQEILKSPETVNLMASYYNLERLDMKLCFLCFSIFPEKAIMKRRSLIYWWIGEGFINQTNDKTAEEVGEDIFQKLLDLGLIKPYSENSEKPNPAVNRCTVHPWIRQMLISLAKEAKLFDFDSREDNISTSRRACLISGNPKFSMDHSSSSGVNALNGENLLTVFNVSESYLSLKPEWLRKWKKLVVLQLGRWQDSPEHHIEVLNGEFLKELGAQKHLKHLCLRGISIINELPSSIVELFSLEILDLRGCHNLETLPSDIERLRKLTHLDVSDCPLLESIPKGVQKLSSLQVLKGFVIGNPREDPCKVADLAKLKKLRRLSVYVGNEAVVKEGEFKKLKVTESLRCLSIMWGVNSPGADHVAAIANLSFPPFLEKLDLTGIPQQSPPKELKPSALNMLRKLHIWGGELSSLDHGETDNWNVQILRLKYLKDFEIDRKKLLRQFPHLIYLEVKCDQIKNGKRKEKYTSNEEVTYKEDFVLTKDELAEERKKWKFEEGNYKPKGDIVSEISEIEEM